jgi:hypothetical protein
LFIAFTNSLDGKIYRNDLQKRFFHTPLALFPSKEFTQLNYHNSTKKTSADEFFYAGRTAGQGIIQNSKNPRLSPLPALPQAHIISA